METEGDCRFYPAYSGRFEMDAFLVPPRKRHVLRWIRNPDKGSAFDRKTRHFRWMWGFILLYFMRRMKYDGILMYDGFSLVGHVFFQKKADVWFVFSVHVVDGKRGKGHARALVHEFLRQAYAEPEVRGVRLGSGGHAAVEHICSSVLSCDQGFDFSVYPDEQGRKGFVWFRR